MGGSAGSGGSCPAPDPILTPLPCPSAAEISVSPAAEVQEGTATTLSCDVPGREGQDLNYTWYKNGAWLKEGSAHTLLFLHAAASDAGYYSCKVTNDRGSDTSQAIRLSVTCEYQGKGGPHQARVQGLCKPPSQYKVSAPNVSGAAERGFSPAGQNLLKIQQFLVTSCI